MLKRDSPKKKNLPFLSSPSFPSGMFGIKPKEGYKIITLMDQFDLGLSFTVPLQTFKWIQIHLDTGVYNKAGLWTSSFEISDRDDDNTAQ